MEVDEFGQDTAVGDPLAAGASSWTSARATSLRTLRRDPPRLQGTSTSIPDEAFLARSYVVTLGALVVRGRNSRTPSALGIPFDRRVA
jgi:ABC-type uncharacterized transport system permease subunit